MIEDILGIAMLVLCGLGLLVLVLAGLMRCPICGKWHAGNAGEDCEE